MSRLFFTIVGNFKIEMIDAMGTGNGQKIEPAWFKIVIFDVNGYSVQPGNTV